MSDVKRYIHGSTGMLIRDDGEWCRYENYDALALKYQGVHTTMLAIRDQRDKYSAEVVDLREQLAAVQSKEVCTVAHSDEVMEFCPYCKIERLRDDLSEIIIELVHAECRERVAKTRLAEAERDAALGRIAIKFVDRAGDYCDVDPAERICDEFSKAMGDEVERQQVARGFPPTRTADSAGEKP